MQKPFTVNIGQEEQTPVGKKPKFRPFTTKDTPVEKTYLILKYYESKLGGEDERDFEFFTGTTQEMYDHLKMDLEGTDYPIDAIRSRILVDSPGITIGTKVTVFMFMRDTREKGKVVDESSFDINDYYYDETEEYGGEMNGEE